MNKSVFKALTKPDIVLIVGLVLSIIISSVVVISGNEKSKIYAVCETRKEKQKFSLNCIRTIELENGMEIEIKEGKIRVKKSDCPNQICVKQGWIENANEVIVCVPNKTLIYLESAAAEDNQVDYISH